jgi:uncharacterized membrane protein YfcA
LVETSLLNVSDMLETLLTISPFFFVALLYASAGHGGASGYLAVMALLGVEAVLLRPTALGLNVLVSLLGTIAFFKAGHFRAKLFWPLALSAIPFAYLGGSLDIQEGLFRKILGVALAVALLRLFMPQRDAEEMRFPPLWQLILAGTAMGFVSGLSGVGGGIFLTPRVIFLGWAPVKTAAAISAPFIMFNSVAGLAGLQPSANDLHPLFLWLAVAVLLGGLLGCSWGSHLAAAKQLRYALALVLSLAAFKMFL